jgi:hypothetical protein
MELKERWGEKDAWVATALDEIRREIKDLTTLLGDFHNGFEKRIGDIEEWMQNDESLEEHGIEPPISNANYGPTGYNKPEIAPCPREYLAVIEQAKTLCEKFVKKVDDGRARSVETYGECMELLNNIRSLPGGEHEEM